MKKLTHECVRFWLDRPQADRLRELASEAGESVEEHVRRLLAPFLDADTDEVVKPVSIDKEVYRIVRDFCDRMEEDEDALLAGEIHMNMLSHHERKLTSGSYE